MIRQLLIALHGSMKVAGLPMYSVLSFIAFFLHLFQTKCEWCDGVGYIYCYCPLIKVINNGPQGHKRPKKVKGRNVNAWKHPLHQGPGQKDRRKKKESTSCGNYEYLDSWLSLFSPFKLWAKFIKWQSTCKKKITLSWKLCLWGCLYFCCMTLMILDVIDYVLAV